CRAKPICFKLLTHDDRRAASRAACTAGRSRAISTAMIAMTTRSSIKVKPRLRMGMLLERRRTLGSNDDAEKGLDATGDANARGKVRQSNNAERTGLFSELLR